MLTHGIVRLQAVDHKFREDLGDLLAGESSRWLEPGEGGVAQAKQRFDDNFSVEIRAEITRFDAFLQDDGPDVFVVFEQDVGGNGRFRIQSHQYFLRVG